MPDLQPKQFTQLQMFMKPSEITAQPRFSFGDAVVLGRPVDVLRTVKLREADDGGRLIRSLAQRIEAEGVKEPIRVRHGGAVSPEGRVSPHARLVDGHHRFFVQERREKRGEEVYLPVQHEDWSR